KLIFSLSWKSSSSRRRSLSGSVSLLKCGCEDCEEQYTADDRAAPDIGLIKSQQDRAENRVQKTRAEDCAGHTALAASQTGASDDGRRNGVQLITVPCRGVSLAAVAPVKHS